MSQQIKNDWVAIRLPSARHFLRFIGWVIGRVIFSLILYCLEVVKYCCHCLISVVDWCKIFLNRIVRLYDQLPYAGTYNTNIIETAIVTLDSPNEIITDIISAIEGKQLMIIGEMGTGKSTIAQYLAYTIGGQVKVYECEGTPDDWQGLEVVGKGENWQAIDEGMQDDLDDLSNQMKIRNEKGDNALIGTDKVIICEEYPELVSKVDSSGEWLERHARRGRKARRFTILLSQYDRVSAWGLEGKSDLADAFYRLRLGKKAVNYAKSLKDDALVNWLRSDRSHCLLDNQPCKLPSYREMKAVTYRLPMSAVTDRSVAGQKFLEKSASPENPEDDLTVTLNSGEVETNVSDRQVSIAALKGCIEAGMSETWVIKVLLGYTGGQYQKGRDLLARLRQEHNF